MCFLKSEIVFQSNAVTDFRGYYPKGGGHVKITVNPVENHIKPIELLNPGEVVEIKGKSFVAGVLPIKVSHFCAIIFSYSK